MIYKKRQTGFTLMEVLVTLVLVAILAGIALPAYTAHVQKARRADVIARILDYQGRFERCYTKEFNYTTCAGDILAEAENYPSDANADYTISVETTANTYTFSATASSSGRQAGDKSLGISCTVLTLNETGSASPAECW